VFLADGKILRNYQWTESECGRFTVVNPEYVWRKYKAQ